MGKMIYHNFVEIPTAKVKNRFQQECDLKKWRFVEPDESCTSKYIFLDREFLPAIVGEKPTFGSLQVSESKEVCTVPRRALSIDAEIDSAANIIRKSKLAVDSICRTSG
ncbi:hypothetical protein [Tychonema sp. LEGE 07203]|uniref:hypothetical protein n=1 Tax=Tychonema sp. LEGE 07203 TaxID=1828671 RepID=UPI001D1557D7|nr:hypothetical protein [Tychonema sp. LEGE 07203]